VTGPSLAGWICWVAGLAGAAVLVWPSAAASTDRIGAWSPEAGAGSTALRSRRARRVSRRGPGWVRWVRRVRRLDRLGRLRARSGSLGGPGFDREVLSLLEGLAGSLRAGLTPARAFAHLAAAADLERSVTTGGRVDAHGATAAEVATDPRSLAALLTRLAAQSTSGAPLEPTWRAGAGAARSAVLFAVADGWGLSERHGAPVADVLDALVVALRDGIRTDAAVETSLAAPRATAALLGVLPLGGVALGELVGVHPLAVLLGSPAGRVVGVAGLVATLGGRVWMRRLVRAVGG
jgi:tight adherence protein B